MTDKPDTVRIADTNDLADLFWQLMNDYQADNGLGWTPSPRKVAQMVRECCEGVNGIAGIIDGLDGPIASIGLEIHTPRYSNDEYLVQAWIFVMPEHRGGHQHWEALFAFAEWWRQDMSNRAGKPFILESSVQSHVRLPAKLRLWRRRAGRQVGGTFWTGEVEEPAQA